MNAQTRFLAYRVEESYFKVKPVKENEKFTLSPKFTCSIKSGKEDFTATLTVELGDGVSVAATPFNLKASVNGRFALGEDVGSDRERQLRFAVNTLFPYLRSFVSFLTATSGLPPFMLPAIDVEAMIGGIKKESANTIYN